MKRKITITILTLIFGVLIILSIYFKTDSLNVLIAIDGSLLFIYLIHVMYQLVIKKKILYFEDKIKKEVLSQKIDKLSDYNRYVYYAYNYLANYTKNLTEQEERQISVAFIIMVLYDIYKEKKKKIFKN